MARSQKRGNINVSLLAGVAIGATVVLIGSSLFSSSSRCPSAIRNERGVPVTEQECKCDSVPKSGSVGLQACPKVSDPDHVRDLHRPPVAKPQESPVSRWQCSSSVKSARAASFELKGLSKDSKQGGCVSDSWVVAFARADPSPNKLIVNIGVNKGWNIVAFSQLWMPQRQVTASSWLKALGDSGVSQHAKGFCDDFQSVGHTAKYLLETTEPAGEGQLEMHVMEPLAGNIAPLQATIDANGLTDAVNVYQMAASDVNGEAQMPKGMTGVESHGLGTNPSGEMETVRVVTLDSWAKEAGIFDRRIDILFIDVEGYDALVIDGGAQLLGSAWNTGRGARWLVFEYHSVGMWPKRSLKEVVAKLDTWGYDCYFAGNRDPLKRMTGCWDDVFEIRHLSNIVCANRNDQIARTVALSIDAMNNRD